MARYSPWHRSSNAVVLCLVENVSPTPSGRISSDMMAQRLLVGPLRWGGGREENDDGAERDQAEEERQTEVPHIAEALRSESTEGRSNAAGDDHGGGLHSVV